jgi:GT2 family glycosyltransferase
MTIECVESVLKSDYPNFTVVVIDNGSCDDSVVALRERFRDGIVIIENAHNLGYAEGFNVGLSYAFEERCADYCLVMNNDTTIDRHAIAALVRVAEKEENIGFVTGKVYYYDAPQTLQTVGRKADPLWWGGPMIGNGEKDNGQYDKISERIFIDDIYTLVDRKLYQDTGGYDSNFFLEAEEYDWQARAKKLGYKFMYTPAARLWHKDSMTIGRDSALKAYYDARNPMLVVLLHKEPEFCRRYLRAHLRMRILRSSLVYLRHGRFACALAKWKGLLSALTWGLKNRKFESCHFI